MGKADYNQYEASDSNINQMIDSAANKLIQSFSGKGNIRKTKVLDNIIAFLGVAGGTGTSTIVSNLAFLIAQKGLTVLVIDMNIEYPIQQSLFKIKQEVEKKDLVSFLLGHNAVGESIEQISKNISVLYANNRYLMDWINCDNSACSKTMTEMLDRMRNLFDVVLIDCPLQIEFDVVNSVLYHCDTIYSIWDESLSCIANMDRIRKNMQSSGVEANSKVKAIFNKKTNVYYTRKIFEQLKVNLVATLPFDVAIIESTLQGEIFCDKGASMSKNASIFMKEMKILADRILEIGGYQE